MDEQQFLNEINAIPWQQPAGTDEYRNALLVFADWLEEQGDPRSELIRLREGLLNDPTPEQRQMWEPRMQQLIQSGVQPVVATWENSIGMKFCWCPPGTFKMGSPETALGRFFDENQVDVALTPGFWLGKYEVTQGEYEKLMGKNPSGFSTSGVNALQVAGLDTSRFPVEQINWKEATRYCKRMMEQDRLEGRLPEVWSYRLPTEAELEYVYRAGTTSEYFCGDSLSNSQANFENTLQRTTRVGAYPPNPWGFYDMHGNLREWCQDWYQKKLPGGKNPVVLKNSRFRVIRGGSWGNIAEYCRSAFRAGNHPGHRGNFIGFRIAAVHAGK